MTISPLTVLSGSPWAATYLRLAGAQVDDESHVGTAAISLPALLRVHTGATVGYGTQLHGHRVAEGVLSLAPVTVGAGAVVGSECVLECGSEVGASAILREQSLLQSGHTIPDGETWAGSPARPAPEAIDPVVELMASCAAAPRTWSRTLLTGFAGGVLLLELLPFLIMLPVVALVWWALLTSGTAVALLAAALSGPLFVATSCALILGVRRLVLPATPEGVHHLRSQLGLEKWLGDKLLELSLLLNNTMYSTLYTPMWLDRKSTRLNSSHAHISYAVFCLKKKKQPRGRCRLARVRDLRALLRGARCPYGGACAWRAAVMDVQRLSLSGARLSRDRRSRAVT